MGHNVIRLTIIREAAATTKKILTINLPEIIFFADDGNTDFTCGKCKAVLAIGIEEEAMNDLVLKCNKCQGLNELSTKPFERAK